MSNEMTRSAAAIKKTTLFMNNMQNKVRIVNALNSSTSLNDEPPTKVFECVGIIIENGVRKGRSGNEDSPCENTYILCADGKSYFSQSDGIARSIKPIAELFFSEDGSVDPGFENGFIPLVVRENKLTNGNTIKVIEIQFD